MSVLIFWALGWVLETAHRGSHFPGHRGENGPEVTVISSPSPRGTRGKRQAQNPAGGGRAGRKAPPPAARPAPPPRGRGQTRPRPPRSRQPGRVSCRHRWAGGGPSGGPTGRRGEAAQTRWSQARAGPPAACGAQVWPRRGRGVPSFPLGPSCAGQDAAAAAPPRPPPPTARPGVVAGTRAPGERVPTP